MARKTTKAAQAAIDHYNACLQHAEGVLRVRATAPVESWTDHTHRWTPEYVEAFMAGVAHTVEMVLSQQGCYAGFYYVAGTGEYLLAERGAEITNHPEFREWRRAYITRG
jgi:hypothetical protein